MQGRVAAGLLLAELDGFKLGKSRVAPVRDRLHLLDALGLSGLDDVADGAGLLAKWQKPSPDTDRTRGKEPERKPDCRHPDPADALTLALTEERAMSSDSSQDGFFEGGIRRGCFEGLAQDAFEVVVGDGPRLAPAETEPVLAAVHAQTSFTRDA